MTGEEFADLIERTGWSLRSIAAMVGVKSHGFLADMKSGRRAVDPLIAAYLQRVVAAIERIPPPELVERRGRWRD